MSDWLNNPFRAWIDTVAARMVMARSRSEPIGLPDNDKEDDDG